MNENLEVELTEIVGIELAKLTVSALEDLKDLAEKAIGDNDLASAAEALGNMTDIIGVLINKSRND